MAHENGLIKIGSYPKGRPHMKGKFDRKVGRLLWGPGTANPLRHKNTRVKFPFYTLDEQTGVYTDTWTFSPTFVRLV
jgi:hypothetical protein